MYDLLMFRNFLRVIKGDCNMWELWQFVFKSLILTSVHLFVLLYELIVSACMSDRNTVRHLLYNVDTWVACDLCPALPLTC